MFPDRMIKLFQQKADNAGKRYDIERQKRPVGDQVDRDTAMLTQAVQVSLRVEAETWQKAADALRRERLGQQS